jgi:hypothetical protein
MAVEAEREQGALQRVEARQVSRSQQPDIQKFVAGRPSFGNAMPRASLLPCAGRAPGFH